MPAHTNPYLRDLNLSSIEHFCKHNKHAKQVLNTGNLTAKQLEVGLLKARLLNNLTQYEHYFNQLKSSVSRNEAVIHLRCLIEGQKDEDGRSLSPAYVFETPEALSDKVHWVIDHVKQTWGEWYRGDYPLLKAAVLDALKSIPEMNRYLYEWNTTKIQDLQNDVVRLTLELTATEQKRDQADEEHTTAQQALQTEREAHQKTRDKVTELEGKRDQQDSEIEVLKTTIVELKGVVDGFTKEMAALLDESKKDNDEYVKKYVAQHKELMETKQQLKEKEALNKMLKENLAEIRKENLEFKGLILELKALLSEQAMKKPLFSPEQTAMKEIDPSYEPPLSQPTTCATEEDLPEKKCITVRPGQSPVPQAS